MLERKVVVVGASAGGISALSELLLGLPADFNTAVFIVRHVGRRLSRLPEVLAHVSKLPVSHPRDGEEIGAGDVYVAPPDMHMVIDDVLIRLVHGAKESFTLPAIDLLYRSVAVCFGLPGGGVADPP